MNEETKRKIASNLRTVARYPWAVVTVPFGLAIGLGGLVQHAYRSVFKRHHYDR